MLRYRKEQSRIHLAFGNGGHTISSMKLMMVLFIIYGWYSNFTGAQVSLLIILLNTRGQDHVASCLSQPHDCQLERRANCHLEQLQTLGHYSSTILVLMYYFDISQYSEKGKLILYYILFVYSSAFTLTFTSYQKIYIEFMILRSWKR